MARSISNNMGLKGDVFTDPNFQKVIEPEMQKVISLIEEKGLGDALSRFFIENKESSVKYDEDNNCFVKVGNGVDTDGGSAVYASKAELTAVFIDQINAVSSEIRNSDEFFRDDTETAELFSSNLADHLPVFEGKEIDAFKNSLVELTDKADRINDAINKSNNYAHLDRHNVFKQYNDLKLMIIAKENDLPLNGKYVTKGEIFMSAYRLINGLTVEAVILSALEQYLDHIEGIDNADDLERYHRTGFLDKTDNNDVTFSLDNGTVLSANDTVDQRDKKIGSVNAVDLNGVKLGGVELIERNGKINIVTDDRNHAVVDGKVTVAVYGFVAKDDRDTLSSDFASKMTYIDKNGNEKLRGVDSPIIVGYKIIDVETKKPETVDVRGNHISGENYKVDFYKLKLDNEQKYLISTRNESDVDSLTNALANKVEPESKDIEKEYDNIEKRIENIDSILQDEKSSITDDEKQKLESIKDELEKDKAVLSEDKGNTDKERIEQSEKKSEVIRKDHSETEIESKHKLETAWNNIEAAVEKESNGQATKDDVDNAKKEYIEKSDLSTSDKESLLKNFRHNPKDTDDKIKNVDFEDKKAVSGIVEKIYSKELDGTSKDDFESEIFKKASDADYEFKSDRVEQVSKNDVEIEKSNDVEKTKSYDLGSLKLDESSKVVREDNKYYIKNSDSKISVSDIGAVTKNRVEIISERGFNNIVSFKGGNVVNDGKLVVAVKGFIGSTDKFSDDFKDKMTYSDSKVSGIDRPITLGYAVFDLESNKTEYRDLRFEHFAGDKIDVSKDNVYFSKEQTQFLDYKAEDNIGIKNDDVKELSSFFEKNISLSDKDIDDKVDKLNDKIAELDSINDMPFITDDEKVEIDAKIKELGSTAAELRSDDIDFKDKIDIYNREISPTTAELTHKEDILRTNMNDKDHDFVDSRIEYIKSLDLSDGDKQKMYNAISKDFSTFDQALKDKTFDEGDKVKSVIKEMYHTDITRNDPDDFKSDICKDTYLKIETEDNVKIDYDKTDNEAKITFTIEGRVVRTEHVDEKREIVSREEYCYNVDGSFSVEVYDRDDKLVETDNYSSDNIVIESTYYDEGEVIEKDSYKYDDGVLSSVESFDKEDNSTKTRFYDEDGQIEKSMIYNYDDGDRVSVSTYDKDDKLIETTYEDKDREADKVEVYDAKDENTSDPTLIRETNDNIAAEIDKSETPDDTTDVLRDNIQVDYKALWEDMDGEENDKIESLFTLLGDTDNFEVISDMNFGDLTSDRSPEENADTFSKLMTELEAKGDNAEGLIDSVKRDFLSLEVENKTERDDAKEHFSMVEAVKEYGVVYEVAYNDVDDKREAIKEGIEGAKKMIQGGALIDNNDRNDESIINAITKAIDGMADDITETVSSAVGSVPDSSDVSKIIVSAIRDSGVDLNKSPKQISSYLTSKASLVDKIEQDSIKLETVSTDCHKDQELMVKEFINDESYKTSDLLENFISGINSAENTKVVDGAFEAYEPSELDYKNFEARFEIVMDRIAEYAKDNPEESDKIANAISRIAQDTGCISKVQVIADEKLSELGVDTKTLNDVFMSRVDDMIDSIYGVTRDEDGNINDIDIDDDKVEAAQAEIGEIVNAVVDIMISDKDDDVKEKIQDLIIDARTSVEDKGTYLDRLTQVLSAVNGAVEKNDNDAICQELDKFEFEERDNDDLGVDRVMEVLDEYDYQESRISNDQESD